MINEVITLQKNTMLYPKLYHRLHYRKLNFNICIYVIIIFQMRALTHDEIEGNCCVFFFEYIFSPLLVTYPSEIYVCILSRTA